jgi:hypothetical protein
MPPEFCRYAIHIIDEVDAEGFDEDLDDPTHNGEPWPPCDQERPVEQRLADALANNDFSTVTPEELPPGIALAGKAAAKTPTDLIGESLTFAIMAQNVDLVEDLLRRAKQNEMDFTKTYLLHVATGHLNGGTTCCMTLDFILERAPKVAQMYVNEDGQTVLDNLILTILKSHARSPIEKLDASLVREARFAGTGLDICGRWDADSHCYRSLLQAGKTEIPPSWKHKFCHSSVQAILHCIESLYVHGLPLPTSSGIFVKHCASCGQKLQLGPLHALTLATFRLALDCCEEEDLFGMSALLVCLLSCRLKSYTTAHISITQLLTPGADDGCNHEDITPFQLAERLSEVQVRLSEETTIGWKVYCQILRAADDMKRRPWFLSGDDDASEAEGSDSPASDAEYDERFYYDEQQLRKGNDANTDPCGDACDDLPLCFEYSAGLGHVWAAFQAEILTHRKQDSDQPWVSDLFDMKLLLQCLESGSAISQPILQRDLLKAYCRCGLFKTGFGRFNTRTRITRKYFGNLDIWERSTFIGPPARIQDIL